MSPYLIADHSQVSYNVRFVAYFDTTGVSPWKVSGVCRRLHLALVCLPAHAVSGKDKNRNHLHGPGSVYLNLCPFMRLQTPRKNRVRNMTLTKVNNRASIIEKCYDTLFSMNSVFCS
jgi:hypothetical protein